MNRYFLALLIFLSTPTIAGSIWCKGQVSNMYVDSADNLIIKGSWRNEYTRICKTDGSSGVNTVTCSLWFSIVTTAITSAKDVQLMYNDQGGSMTCATIPYYSNAPTPAYLMLVK